MDAEVMKMIEEEKAREEEKSRQENSQLKEYEPYALSKVQNVTSETDFSKAVDKAKIDVMKEAWVNDTKFTNDFKEQLKKATIKSAELETEKQDLEKQNIVFQNELLETKKKLNEYTQSKDSWESKQKSRQFHYDGVSPIMEFVNIKKPMNLVILYFLVLILIIPFLLSKLFKGTIGNMISGAEDSNRPKAVKGFLLTMLGVIFVMAITLVTYLALLWLNII